MPSVVKCTEKVYDVSETRVRSVLHMEIVKHSTLEESLSLVRGQIFHHFHGDGQMGALKGSRVDNAIATLTEHV
jgi:hypothetical protein